MSGPVVATGSALAAVYTAQPSTSDHPSRGGGAGSAAAVAGCPAASSATCSTPPSPMPARDCQPSTWRPASSRTTCDAQAQAPSRSPSLMPSWSARCSSSRSSIHTSSIAECNSRYSTGPAGAGGRLGDQLAARAGGAAEDRDRRPAPAQQPSVVPASVLDVEHAVQQLLAPPR